MEENERIESEGIQEEKEQKEPERIPEEKEQPKSDKGGKKPMSKKMMIALIAAAAAVVIAVVLTVVLVVALPKSSGDDGSNTVELSTSLENSIKDVDSVKDVKVDAEKKTIELSVGSSTTTFSLSSIQLAEGTTLKVYTDATMTTEVTGDVTLKEGNNSFYAVLTKGETTVKYTFTVVREKNTSDPGVSGDPADPAEPSEPEEPVVEHVHSFGDWSVVTPADCTKKGLKKHTCACGEEETEEIEMREHTLTVWSSDEVSHWHVCSVCEQKIGEETHTYDDDHDTVCNECGYVRDLGDHVASELQYDETGHWYGCSHPGCTLKFVYAEHDYANEHALECGCGYVRTIDDDHTMGMDFQSDETGHWIVCMHPGCTYKFSMGNHTPESVMSYDETGHWYECQSGCGYQIDFEPHDEYDVLYFDDDGRWSECTLCGYVSDPVAHQYDDDHDDECNVCGYTRVLTEHTASGVWSTDENSHWHDCTFDGCTIKFDEEEHTIVTEWQKDATNHWHACDVCGYVEDEAEHVYDDDSDSTCNVCGYERLLHVHTYNYVHDTTCNICGEVRTLEEGHGPATTWSNDGQYHWHKCTYPGCQLIFDYEAHDVIMPEECSVCGDYDGFSGLQHTHVYDDDGDATCNICGIARSVTHEHSWSSVWNKNEGTHWHACEYNGCEAKNSSAGHDYDDSHDTTCNTCGYVREPIHSWSSEWMTDATNHWHTCTYVGCTATDIAAHDYDNVHDTTCNTCGYVREIPAGHAAASAWSHDATHHWHACTYDGCDYTYDYAAHTIAGDVCSVCSAAIDNTPGLQFTEDGNKYKVTGYTGDSSVVIIKSTYNGKSVTSIGNKAFYDCTSLTSVTIPSSVTSIGNNAFYSCTSLTSVTIPSSVTSIGVNAFLSCTSLTNIIIPSSVTSIGSYAFTGSKKNVYYAGTIASWCGITFDDSPFGDFYGYDLYINDELQSDIIIPVGVTEIKANAFGYCRSLTSVTIPSSVTSIGRRAFAVIGSLSKVNYTGTIASWCGITFGDGKANPIYGSRDLYINDELLPSTITIPGSVTEIKQYAFQRWSGTSVTIQSGVTTIGQYAFAYCQNLASVTLNGNTLTTIGEYAFSYCTALSSFTIPDSVTTIGDQAFASCTALSSLTIGNHVQSIGGNAFQKTGLTSVTIPGSVTNLGRNIFNSCTALSSVTIQYGVTSIGDYMFDGCTSLTNIIIPSSVTSIGKYAFSECTSITSFTIPSTVTRIGQYAFTKSGLTSISIPSSVTIETIDTHIFDGCTSLTSATLASGATRISQYMFAGCTALKYVYIPTSVTAIAQRAFSGCTGLTDIYYNGTKSQWWNISKDMSGGNAWNHNTGNFIIHCSDGNLDKSSNAI